MLQMLTEKRSAGNFAVFNGNLLCNDRFYDRRSDAVASAEAIKGMFAGQDTGDIHVRRFFDGEWRR